jgi:hypothetical protein
MWAVLLPRVLQLSLSCSGVSHSCRTCYITAGASHGASGWPAGHIHRHPVAYVRSNIRIRVTAIEACVYSELLSIERNEI